MTATPTVSTGVDMSAVWAAEDVAVFTSVTAWRAGAHPLQCYTHDVAVWVLLGGRRSGKTWGGAHSFAETVALAGGVDGDGARRVWLVLARDVGQAWRVLVRGKSGLVRAFRAAGYGTVLRKHESELVVHGPRMGREGALIVVKSFDAAGAGSQGDGYSGVWVDEIGLISRTGWEELWVDSVLASLSVEPRACILTGTPKEGHPFVRYLRDRAAEADTDTVVNIMPTSENPYLPAAYHAEWARLAGTRKYRSEYLGEYVEDVEGALWSHDAIHADCVTELPDEVADLVVCVDPNRSASEDADPAGVTVLARDTDDDWPTYFVAHSEAISGRTPRRVMDHVFALADEWGATAVVYERDGTDDWFADLWFGTVDTRRRFPLVAARTGGRSKKARALPVAALSEQHRLRLVGGTESHAVLVEEMCSRVPGDGESPNVLDSMVHGITYLSDGDRFGPGQGAWVDGADEGLIGVGS